MQITGRPSLNYPNGTKKVALTLCPEHQEILEEVSYKFMKTHKGKATRAYRGEIVRSIIVGLQMSGVFDELCEVSKELPVTQLDGSPKLNRDGSPKTRLVWDEEAVAYKLDEILRRGKCR